MIDSIDRRLLAFLEMDARKSNAELGDLVGLTASSVHERVKKLERLGIITGYGARVDAGRIGKGLLAFMRLSFGATDNEGIEEVKARLRALCEDEADIQECHNVAGEDCYIIKMRAAGPPDLESLISKIRVAARASRTVTSIVLSTCKESALVLPVEAPAPAGHGDSPGLGG